MKPRTMTRSGESSRKSRTRSSTVLKRLPFRPSQGHGVNRRIQRVEQLAAPADAHQRGSERCSVKVRHQRSRMPLRTPDAEVGDHVDHSKPTCGAHRVTSRYSASTARHVTSTSNSVAHALKSSCTEAHPLGAVDQDSS